MSRVEENGNHIEMSDAGEGKEEVVQLNGSENTSGMNKENSSSVPVAVNDMVPKDKLYALVSSAQEEEDNRKRLDENFNGTQGLAKSLRVDLSSGLATGQVELLRQTYGPNAFPEIPMKGFCILFAESFNDTILLVLIAAAVVSLVIGMIEHPDTGWIDGVAILMAVLIVALVTAGNDYSKELQFRALEKTSEEGNRAMALRDGVEQLVHPQELVVGDVVVMKPGDGIPADGLLFAGEGVKSNESGLTGEPDDLTKKAEADCFLYSSCTLTEVGQSADCKMMVHSVGEQSQWGQIRATLVSEPQQTPLQQKLDRMAKLIGYIGVAFAVATFTALIVMIWARHDGQDVAEHVVEAFIIAVTIVVVAIPEGLPLAVTISLAYSTRKMYKDQNLIRVLAACETMGNATNICSDKTGTLTENQMTAVEGWFSDKHVTQDSIKSAESLSPAALDLVSQNIAINRSCTVHFKDEEGHDLHKPKVIGSATEGALVILASDWGFNSISVKDAFFNSERDCEYPFNSAKKRSSVLINQQDGTLRLYTKGASETILADCTRYTTQSGEVVDMSSEKRQELEDLILTMANNALRTLCLAHIDYASVSELDEGYEIDSPDADNMILDAVVGIMDPLRGDVKDAVATAQHAGVMVRMVTGDNINTAKAIAKQCGIYDPDYGVALEGPVFRAMSPAQLDEVLPRLQVLARSSPNDKYLLVTRLNGVGIPADEQEWKDLHDKDGSLGLSWAAHKDLLLPGYKEEWKRGRKGGEVVGVTGDGTNDAPALKAADVGLSMGITGTKVAQNASDIVILDDKFSSIVRAIMWGRGVYDNIRKFLQFQLTVNVVALLIVFIGALSGKDPPLNPLMMLWVNLIMDTMGALALGTESPTMELLDRRPYRRTAPLISRPMFRNIMVQSTFQLGLLLFLLYDPHTLFPGILRDNACKEWTIDEVSDPSEIVGGYFCSDYRTFVNGDCTSDKEFECFEEFFSGFESNDAEDEFQSRCNMDCDQEDYTHYSILFNAFVFCQIFNELNARSIFDEWNVLKGLHKNPLFIGVIIITTILQYLIVEMGAEFTKTAHLSSREWLITVALGAIALPLGMFMRFIPVKENPTSFSGYATPEEQRLLTARGDGQNV